MYTPLTGNPHLDKDLIEERQRDLLEEVEADRLAEGDRVEEGDYQPVTDDPDEFIPTRRENLHVHKDEH